MNRQEALEWLVENVTKWPTGGEQMRSLPDHEHDNWFWLYVGAGEIQFFCEDYIVDDTQEPITQADWLAATDDMPRKDCESVFE